MIETTPKPIVQECHGQLAFTEHEADQPGVPGGRHGGGGQRVRGGHPLRRGAHPGRADAAGTRRDGEELHQERRILPISVLITGLPAYSDSVGTAKSVTVSGKLLTVSKHFYCTKVQLGSQKSVTARGELLTVSQ